MDILLPFSSPISYPFLFSRHRRSPFRPPPPPPLPSLLCRNLVAAYSEKSVEAGNPKSWLHKGCLLAKPSPWRGLRTTANIGNLKVNWVVPVNFVVFSSSLFFLIWWPRLAKVSGCRRRMWRSPCWIFGLSCCSRVLGNEIVGKRLNCFDWFRDFFYWDL